MQSVSRDSHPRRFDGRFRPSVSRARIECTVSLKCWAPALRTFSPNVGFRPIADISASLDMGSMRSAPVALLFVLVAGCRAQPSEVDQIEIRLTGATDLDVTVNRQGKGHYDDRRPMGESGSFSITRAQYMHLLDRLQPYRRLAAPVTAKGRPESIDMTCAKGTPVLPGTDTISVHWTGNHLDEFYGVNLVCDWKRKAVDNDGLFAALRSLPIPGGDAEWSDSLKSLSKAETDTRAKRQ